MPWELNSDKPIYLQLMDRVIQDIVSGKLTPGEKLRSVRDLACDAAVNPNTMQKALSELEHSGLVYSQRTSGRFITEDTKLIKHAKLQLAQAESRAFLARMIQLGFNNEETIALISNLKEEENYE